MRIASVKREKRFSVGKQRASASSVRQRLKTHQNFVTVLDTRAAHHLALIGGKRRAGAQQHTHKKKHTWAFVKKQKKNEASNSADS